MATWAMVPLLALAVASLGYNTVHAQQDFDVRLAGSSSSYEGRLEIFYDGVWGTVCDYDQVLNDAVATVACRQLGFQRGRVARELSSVTGQMEPRQFPLPDPPPPMTLGGGIFCDPDKALTATNLGDCSYNFNDWSFWLSIKWCDPEGKSLAAIQCGGDSHPLEFDARLVPNPVSPSSPAQLLELYVNGTWSNVCADSFEASDPEAVNVVCRQLGYDKGKLRSALHRDVHSSSSLAPFHASACWFWSAYNERLPSVVTDCGNYTARPTDNWPACHGPGAHAALLECSYKVSLFQEIEERIEENTILTNVVDTIKRFWVFAEDLPGLGDTLRAVADIGRALRDWLRGMDSVAWTLEDVLGFVEGIGKAVTSVTTVGDWLHEHLGVRVRLPRTVEAFFTGGVDFTLRGASQTALQRVLYPSVRVMLGTDTGSVIADYLLLTQSVSVSDLLTTTDFDQLLAKLRQSSLAFNIEWVATDENDDTVVQPLIENFVQDVMRYVYTEVHDAGRLTWGQVVLDVAAATQELLKRALAEAVDLAPDARDRLDMSMTGSERRAFEDVLGWLRWVSSQPQRVARVSNAVIGKASELYNTDAAQGVRDAVSNPGQIGGLLQEQVVDRATGAYYGTDTTASKVWKTATNPGKVINAVSDALNQGTVRAVRRVVTNPAKIVGTVRDSAVDPALDAYHQGAVQTVQDIITHPGDIVDVVKEQVVDRISDVVNSDVGGLVQNVIRNPGEAAGFVADSASQVVGMGQDAISTGADVVSTIPDIVSAVINSDPAHKAKDVISDPTMVSDALQEQVLDRVTDVAGSDPIQKVKSTIEDPSSIGDAVGGATDAVQGALGSDVAYLALDLVTSAIEQPGLFARGVAGGVADIVGGVVDQGAVQTVTGVVQGVAAQPGKLTGTAGDSVEAVETVVGRASDAVHVGKGVASTLTDVGSKAGGAGGAVQGVKDVVEGVVGTAADVAGSGDVGTGMAGGVKDAVGGVANAISDAAREAADTVQGGLDRASDQVTADRADIVQGVVRTAFDAATDPGSLVDGVSNALPTVQGQDPVNLAINAVGEVRDLPGRVVGVAGEQLHRITSNSDQGLIDRAQGVVNDVRSEAGDTVDRVLGKATKPLNFSI